MPVEDMDEGSPPDSDSEWSETDSETGECEDDDSSIVRDMSTLPSTFKRLTMNSKTIFEHRNDMNELEEEPASISFDNIVEITELCRVVSTKISDFPKRAVELQTWNMETKRKEDLIPIKTNVESGVISRRNPAQSLSQYSV
jgi:hypothetical protein